MAHSTKLIFCLLFVTWATCVIAEAIQEREISKTAVGFTANEKTAILNKHNELRRLQKASNMQTMTWDPALEKMSQNWANRCIFQHTPIGNGAAGYPSIGENIYVYSATYDAAAPVQAWYDEVKDYDYRTNTCAPGKICGHYTQIVWADTKAVGCGVKYCDNVVGFGRSGYFTVCQYGPGPPEKGVVHAHQNMS